MIAYNRHNSPLMIKSQAFSVRITNMVEFLLRNRSQNMRPLYNQVLRSGTSIMANISESQFAQSGADFITKLHIALKEANETQNWITLSHEQKCLTQKECESMTKDCNEIIAMLVSSLNTSKRNQQQVVK